MARLFSALLISCFLFGSIFTRNIEQYEDSDRLGGVIEALINATLNTILGRVSDPIYIESLNVNLSADALNGNISISKLNLYGIKDLVATYIKSDIFNLQTSMTLINPEITLEAEYDINVLLASLVPFYGAGKISTTIANTNVSFAGKANISNGLSFSNVTIGFTVDDAKFSVTGVLNNDELSALITEALNDNVASFINTYEDVISSLISSAAEEIINNIINGNSTEEIYSDTLSIINDAFYPVLSIN
ncbi:uncharacterized protein LOC115884081 [Sitophilus oryzae]|uniref:Uncharacterized protein LOC115884081 n=1 Tax=Sitophilus oryzae TaxID=7048 RepID=A0A6J2Y409_SITOR|nr:uncharacterized protein LOC115884081 [Sitophilus oryzae]